MPWGWPRCRVTKPSPHKPPCSQRSQAAPGPGSIHGQGRSLASVNWAPSWLRGNTARELLTLPEPQALICHPGELEAGTGPGHGSDEPPRKRGFLSVISVLTQPATRGIWDQFPCCGPRIWSIERGPWQVLTDSQPGTMPL